MNAPKILPVGADALDTLVKAHPRLFHGEYPRSASDLLRGWYGLVDELLQQIDGLLTDEQVKSIRIVQIKEKFGVLRVYLRNMSAQYEDPDEELVAEKDTKKDDDMVLIMRQVHALVELACHRSEQTCAACSAPGQLRRDRGWIVTLCDACNDLPPEELRKLF